MENGQVKIFVPRSGANAVPGTDEKIVDIPAAASNSDQPETGDKLYWRFFKGTGYFFGGMIIGAGLFIAVYFLLSKFFVLDYLLKSIIALAIAVGFGKAFTDATKEKTITGPLTIFVIIAFGLSLLYGSEYGIDSNLRSEAQTEINSEAPVETLTIATTEAFPMTSRCYHTGEQAKIVVLNNPVRMYLGKRLSVGEHTINIESDGRICFYIEKNAPAKVEVY